MRKSSIQAACVLLSYFKCDISSYGVRPFVHKGFRVITLNIILHSILIFVPISGVIFSPILTINEIALDCVFPVSVFRMSGVEIRGRQHSTAWAASDLASHCNTSHFSGLICA